MIVGRLGRPNGLKGFLGLYVEPENLVYFETGATVLIESKPHTVRGLRRGKKGHEVAFREVSDRDAAEQIRGLDVHVADRRSLDEHEFWPDQLVGLRVVPGGGVVAAVELGAAQDRLVVERDEERFEVPFVDELVPVVDVPGGFVEIVEIEGLSPGPE